MHTTSDPAPEFSASRVLRLLRSGTCSTADATLLSTHLVKQCESGDAAATFAWRATQSLARVALDATAPWAARAGAATALERVAKLPHRVGRVRVLDVRARPIGGGRALDIEP